MQSMVVLIASLLLCLTIPKSGSFQFYPSRILHSYNPSGLNSWKTGTTNRKSGLYESVENDVLEKNEEEQMDETLRNLFAEQVEEAIRHDEPKSAFRGYKKIPKTKRKSIVEEAVVGLIPETPVAYVHQKKLHFGNFVAQRENSTGLYIRKTNGEIEQFGPENIVEVWDDLSDVNPPTTPVQWAETVSRAISVFKLLSPRKTFLEDFWTYFDHYSYHLPVNSVDLCVYIFQEKKFKHWLLPIHENVEETGNFEVRQFNSGERYAALTLLLSDYLHFKRRKSVISYPEEFVKFHTETAVERYEQKNAIKEQKEPKKEKGFVEEDDAEERNRDEMAGGMMEWDLELLDTDRGFKRISPRPTLSDSLPPLSARSLDKENQMILKKATAFLKVGGFKRLLRSVVLWYKVDIFSKYYYQKMNNTFLLNQTFLNNTRTTLASFSPVNNSKNIYGLPDTMESSIIIYLLKGLEMVSYAHDEQRAPVVIKSVLKRLSFPITAYGARMLLQTLGHGQYHFKERNKGIIPSKTTITPPKTTTTWSPEVLEEIDRLLAFSEKRKAMLNDYKTIGKVGKVSLFHKFDYRLYSITADDENSQLRQFLLQQQNDKNVNNNDPKNSYLSQFQQYPNQQFLEYHPPICIDSRDTSNFDDAISVSPATSEILIHIVDVREYLKNFPLLNKIAKERASSKFFDSGSPSHLFPIPVLQSLKLSEKQPNEVLTVAVKMDFVTGEIINYRLFPAIIGPVVHVSDEQVDLMAMNVPNSHSSFHPQIVQDILLLSSLAEKMDRLDPWLNSNLLNHGWLKNQRMTTPELFERRTSSFSSGSPFRNRNNNRGRSSPFSSYSSRRNPPFFSSSASSSSLFRDNPYEQELHSFEIPPSYKIINSFLTLYSNCSYQSVADRELAVPITYENYDPLNRQLIRRFGTQPLRNYLSQLQQHQLRYGLRLEHQKLSNPECGTAVVNYKQQQSLYHKIESQNELKRNQDRFEKQFQRTRRDNDNNKNNNDDSGSGSGGMKKNMIFQAVGRGKGGHVMLIPTFIRAIVNKTVRQGEKILVRIEKYLPRSKMAFGTVVEDHNDNGSNTGRSRGRRLFHR
jgi:predicted transcriptional regulator